MKTKIKVSGLLLAVATVALSACSDDDGESYYKITANAVVTVRHGGDKMVLQLDDSTALTATNVSKSPYGKEVRALANLSDIDKNAKTVYVNWLDTILTKPLSHNFAAKNDSAYGNDPVEIVNSFETVAEDGYLTLRFRTLWGGGKAHGVSLVHRSDANTPYLLDFYHNANGDSKGYVSDWVAAFRLPDEFNQGREPITITLRWKSFQKQAAGDSVKTTTFKYKPRR